MRIYTAALFLIIFTACAAYGQESGSRPVQVTAAVIEKGFTRPNITLTGSAFFTQTSDIASESASKIVKVFVKDGDVVKEGQAIAQLDDSFLTYSIEAAEANTKQALLILEKTKRDLQRNQTLYQQNSISQQKYQDSLTDYENAENAYKAAQADEKKLKIEKEKMIIKAPFAGVITDTPAEVGEWMALGGTAASVASMTYEARVYLPEKVLPYVKSGLKVQVKAAGKEFTGTVSSVNPKGDAATRTFEAKIAIGSDPVLKEGVKTTVNVPSGASEEALLVPRDAIVNKNSVKGVYKIKDGAAYFIPVEIVGPAGEKTAIRSGELAAGDNVVIKGNNLVKDGSVLNVIADLK